MRRFLFALATLAVALAAGSASAQTKKIQDKIEAKLEEARAANRMEEDIEIFRRLLNRGLVEAYPPSAWAAAAGCPAFAPGRLGLRATGGTSSSTGTGSFGTGTTTFGTTFSLGSSGSFRDWLSSGHGGFPTPAAEGVCLKGCGVVYTVTLPEPARNPLAKPAQTAEKPLSPWERERRELRGEKTETPAKHDAERPSLSEAILRLLADNGTHFTELAPDEQITVAVVFRSGKAFAAQNCVACHKGETPGDAAVDPFRPNVPLPMDPMGRDRPGTPPRGPGADTGDSGEVRPGTGRPEGRGLVSLEESLTQFRNSIATGDLYFKQGKYNTALRYYQEVLDESERALNILLIGQDAKSPVAPLLKLLTVMLEANGKIAQAQLAAGQTDDALKTLKKSAEFSSKIEQLAKKEPAPAKPAVPLPSKLVISVPKKVLDQVGSGKMSFDDFRKAATVEYTGAAKDPNTKP